MSPLSRCPPDALRSIPVAKRAIADHYDRCSWLYANLWGEHLHHGYWTADEPLARAQLALIEQLAAAARVPAGAAVLDAGCGLGGSAMWLARELGCRVLGVTLSGVQARMARRRVRRAGLAAQVRVEQGDLEAWDAPPRSLDLVWMIESTEHFQDKAAFLARAAEWLRPGGAAALCAWTPADGLRPDAWARYIEPVCRGFLCPSLAAPGEYAAWLEQAGLRVEVQTDLTDHTCRSWEIGMERTDRLWVRLIAAVLGRDTRRFLRSFPLIRDAYRAGALRYTQIVARKPVADVDGGEKTP